jgi:hypothetical protein
MPKKASFIYRVGHIISAGSLGREFQKMDEEGKVERR